MAKKSKPFPDQETFDRIYEDFCEDRPSCSETLIGKREKLEDMYYDFYNGIEEEMFRLAYEAGWNAAVKGGVSR